MSQNANDEITLLVMEEYATRRVTRGEGEVVARKLSVGTLRERFKEFMTQLQSIVELGGRESDPFQLTRIEFSAEISANGEFKLIGTGAGIEVRNAVTFVLERQKPK
jgi:hypothetical protein